MERSMAVHVVDGLEMNVDRGPNWLFVKLRGKKAPRTAVPHIADKLWSISTRHFIYRLVLELDELEEIPPGWMDELVDLQQRLTECGGALRICGVMPDAEHVASSSGNSDSRLSSHATRAEAVLGSREYAVMPR
jgi:hypothetical protein